MSRVKKVKINCAINYQPAAAAVAIYEPQWPKLL